MALKNGFRGLWFEVGMLVKDYGWLRLTAAADCGPLLVPDGRLQGVGVRVATFSCLFSLNN